MLCAVLATLALQQPTYKLVETFTSKYDPIIGSPRSDCFYMEHHLVPDPEIEDDNQLAIQVLKKLPGKAPELTQNLNGQPQRLGTDEKGRPVYQSNFVKTTTIGQDPQPKDNFDSRAYLLDSGMRIEYPNDITVALTGPERTSPVMHFPSGINQDKSYAILTTRPWMISSDGIDHFITLTPDKNESPQNLILTLYKWGEKLNSLDIQTTYKIPIYNGNDVMHITGLASVKSGVCYIVLESWTRIDNRYTDTAKREILALDLVKGTKSTVVSSTIPGPTDGPEMSLHTGRVDICTIQDGKYIAVYEGTTISIYQRP